MGKEMKAEEAIDIFLQGDSRYSHGDLDKVVHFFNSQALVLEKFDLKDFIIDQTFLSEAYGPQKLQKAVARTALNSFGYTFLNYEHNIDWGIVDILAEDKKGNLVAIECGPCRLSKLINYFRIIHLSELWVVSVYSDEQFLYIIKRGPKWSEILEEKDKEWEAILKTIESPMDMLKRQKNGKNQQEKEGTDDKNTT